MGTLALPCFKGDGDCLICLISICIWAFDGICAWMIVGGLPTGNKPCFNGNPQLVGCDAQWLINRRLTSQWLFSVDPLPPFYLKAMCIGDPMFWVVLSNQILTIAVCAQLLMMLGCRLKQLDIIPKSWEETAAWEVHILGQDLDTLKVPAMQES